MTLKGFVWTLKQYFAHCACQTSLFQIPKRLSSAVYTKVGQKQLCESLHCYLVFGVLGSAALCCCRFAGLSSIFLQTLSLESQKLVVKHVSTQKIGCAVHFRWFTPCSRYRKASWGGVAILLSSICRQVVHTLFWVRVSFQQCVGRSSMQYLLQKHSIRWVA